MSAKNVKGFFEKVEKDKALQTKLKAMHKKAVGESKATFGAEVVEIASAAGFEFTAKELAQASAAKAKKMPKGALAEVAGQEMCSSVNYYCTSSWYCMGFSWS
jgi:predicted ribosomally synthesized peptide with nif11-like leader